MTYFELRTSNSELRTANCEQRTANSLDERKAAGFSLIEVLVATALLVMIVGMIGFVFRQSSMSWDSGTRRADNISQIRSVVGAIERDLRLAVDAREFGMDQKFDRSRLEFIVLADPDPENPDDRGLMQIVYDGNDVERTATRLVYNGTGWTASGTKVGPTPLLLDDSTTSSKKDLPSVKFAAKFADDDPDHSGLPVYVTIEADITVTESFSGLMVRSTGPNGKENAEGGDDIVVE